MHPHGLLGAKGRGSSSRLVMAGTRQSAFRRSGELNERLRTIRQRVVSDGERVFRVILPGSVRPEPGPPFRSEGDALGFARSRGASVAEVVEIATDGALQFRVASREWLLSWSPVGVADVSGVDGEGA